MPIFDGSGTINFGGGVNGKRTGKKISGGYNKMFPAMGKGKGKKVGKNGKVFPRMGKGIASGNPFVF